MSIPERAAKKVLARLPLAENVEILRVLRNETTGGFLLLGATIVALLWANLGGDSYTSMITTKVGPESLHLDLSLRGWAADGLLAVFFLVAGLELKRELVVGQLRNPARAILPVVAAVCGMIVPALIYTFVNLAGSDSGGNLRGWAVPTATDIAFALAVLAVVGSALPTPLRAFLLTLAVVDDLLAIIIIALFFSSDLHPTALLVAAGLLALYRFMQVKRVDNWWLYTPLLLFIWAFVHEGGVHATVAGVLIGLLTRTKHDPGEHESPAERVEHHVRPWSAALCVPLFALTNAGVIVSGEELIKVVTEPIAIGVVLGLVLGKTVGIFGGTWLAARFTSASLDSDLSWSDVLGVSVLAGIGFTVSLLIGELAFDGNEEVENLVKASVLVGSILAALLGVIVLARRNAHYKEIARRERRDRNADGIPDVYQQEPPL